MDTVRAAGGNHLRRNLIVMVYAGNGRKASLAKFILPDDPAEGHLLVEVHNYDPESFTRTDATWTRMTARWKARLHGAALRREFEAYRQYSEEWQVPIVLGEYNADLKRYADYD